MVDLAGSATSGSTNVQVLKKSQDLMKAQGDMAVRLINNAGATTAQASSPQAATNPEGTGTIVSKYA